MLVPILGGRITDIFDTMRPIGNPMHKHGAIDVAGGDGMVLAPADGVVIAYTLLRAPGGGWASGEKTTITDEPEHDYWYDTYGGVIGLQEQNGRHHVLAHFWPAALQKRFGAFHYIESRGTNRWPSVMLRSEPHMVKRGEPLAKIGNAGYSFGAHVHWEVHPTRELAWYDKRIDPETLVD